MKVLQNVILSCIMGYATPWLGTAQDNHPIQMNTVPLLINPAMAGLISGDMRMANGYTRAKYDGYEISHYNQLNLSFDMRLLNGVLPEGDAMGFGVSYLGNWKNSESTHDKRVTSAPSLSVAYHKSIGKQNNHHVSLGGSVTSFDEHRSPGTFGSSLSNYVRDINVGIMYSGKLSEKAGLSFGYSIKHFLRFSYDPDNRNYQNWLPTFFASGVYKINSKTDVYLNATVPVSREWGAAAIIGGYGRTSLSASGKLAGLAGLWYYYGEAVSPYVALEVAKFRFGASYSFVPNYDSERVVGLFELSIVYSGGFFRNSGTAQAPGWHCPAIF